MLRPLRELRIQHEDICGLQPEPVEGFHCSQPIFKKNERGCRT
jgi:hypothetical protein